MNIYQHFPYIKTVLIAERLELLLIHDFGALRPIITIIPDYSHFKRLDQFVTFIDVCPHAKIQLNSSSSFTILAFKESWNLIGQNHFWASSSGLPKHSHFKKTKSDCCLYGSPPKTYKLIKHLSSFKRY